jgi:nicotinamide mononucleotide (NMN) deamidase PncC
MANEELDSTGLISGMMVSAMASSVAHSSGPRTSLGAGGIGLSRIVYPDIFADNISE